MNYHDNKPSIEEAMVHYGVKGMKWGVRRSDDEIARSKGKKEPKKQSKRQTKRQVKQVKKAKQLDKQAEIWDTKVKDLKASKAAKGKSKSYFTDNKIKDAERQATRLRDESKDLKSREGRLSRKQKLAIAGAAAVGAYLVYQGVQSGDFNRLATKGKHFLGQGDEFTSWKTDQRLSQPMSKEALFYGVVRPINPGYGQPGTKVNCRRATFAYEMRRRGYDVKATRTTNGRGQTAIGLYNALTPGENEAPTGSGVSAFATRFKVVGRVRDREAGRAPRKPDTTDRLVDFSKRLSGQNPISFSDSDQSGADILKALGSQPNGSRGEFGTVWGVGGGHSMAYEIVKGKPVIFDTQTGDMLDTAAKVSAHLGGKGMKEAGFTRLDNAPIDYDFVERWVKDAK